MNLLDWILLAILLLSMIPAMVKGFVYEVLMMAATIVLIYLAFAHYHWAARHIGFGTPEVRSFLGFVAILCGGILLAMVLGRLLSRMVHSTPLRWFDRLLGAAFGLVRGVVIVTVLLMMMTAFPVNFGQLQGSLLAPDFLRVGGVFSDFLPQPVGLKFRQGLAQIRKAAAPGRLAGEPGTHSAAPGKQVARMATRPASPQPGVAVRVPVKFKLAR